MQGQNDWAYLELVDLDAAQYNSMLTGEWTRGLLIRHNIAHGALAFFSTWCSKGMPAKKLIAVEGRRWAIEDSFETAKSEFLAEQRTYPRLHIPQSPQLLRQPSMISRNHSGPSIQKFGEYATVMLN